MVRKQLVIGHRGAAEESPENTMKAFHHAWKVGADMIELDVQETSDGHLVCMHDFDIARTTSGQGLVSELSLKEIQSFDAGEKEIVPLLSDVLDFARNRIPVNIELKVFDIERKILEMVDNREMQDQVVYSSFLHGTLNTIVDLQPNASTAVLLNSRIESAIEYTLELKAKSVNPRFTTIDRDLIVAAHEAGLKVYPWTVNDENSMIKLLRWNVDGIITDRPELCIRVMSDIEC
jgi:glycerophosphoryl diester phosphodiesterase